VTFASLVVVVAVVWLGVLVVLLRLVAAMERTERLIVSANSAGAHRGQPRG
jgi:hypothetical protein